MVLEKYNIDSDMSIYALYVVYQNKERCLSLFENSFVIFKQRDKEGTTPMLMLRKHATPTIGYVQDAEVSVSARPVQDTGTGKWEDGSSLS